MDNLTPSSPSQSHENNSDHTTHKNSDHAAPQAGREDRRSCSSAPHSGSSRAPNAKSVTAGNAKSVTEPPCTNNHTPHNPREEEGEETPCCVDSEAKPPSQNGPQRPSDPFIGRYPARSGASEDAQSVTEPAAKSVTAKSVTAPDAKSVTVDFTGHTSADEDPPMCGDGFPSFGDFGAESLTIDSSLDDEKLSKEDEVLGEADDPSEEYARHWIERRCHLRSAPAWFVQEIYRHYPELKAMPTRVDVTVRGKDRRVNPQATFFNLLVAVTLTVRRGDPNQRIVVPWQAVAECMGYGWDEHRNYIREGLATHKYLEAFVEVFLPGAYIAKPHSQGRYGGGGRATELVGVEAALGDAVLDLRATAFTISPSKLTDRVFLDYKATPWSKDKARRRKPKSRVPSSKLEEAKCDLARDLMKYLNDNPSNGYVISEEQEDAAYAFLEGRGTSSWRENHQMQLAALIDDPLPQYAPTERSSRLSPSKISLATIKGEFRPICAPDWIELDLASSQLAINSVDWPLPKVHDHLQRGESIWLVLYDDMGLERYGVSAAQVKPAIKRGVYACCYGACKKTMYNRMREEYDDLQSQDPTLPDLPKVAFERIFDSPLMSEIWEVRKEKMDQIKAEGGARDCFGRWISCEDFSTRSILSQLSQSRELKLLEPAIRLALDERRRSKEDGIRERFRIALWQHDGFSIWVRDKERATSTIEEIKSVVNENIGPYPTRLEEKYTPDWLKEQREDRV